MDKLPYDPNRLYVVSFSGGKDSVATWLYLTRVLKLPNVLCVFADTGHEAKATYEYLAYLMKQGCPLVGVQAQVRDLRVHWPLCYSDEYLDTPLTMELLATIKHRFPSATRRFCTQFLKHVPLEKYLSTLDNPVSVVGIRREESEARSLLGETDFDLDYQREIWRPIINWTADDVFRLHRECGIEPNPLYKLGCARVGCYPCIMSRKTELNAIATYDPGRFDEVFAMEQRVASTLDKNVMTFFAKKTTPPAYRSVKDDKSGKMVPTMMDVKRWALGLGPHGESQGDVFDEEEEQEPPSCTSLYGLCE